MATIACSSRLTASVKSAPTKKVSGVVRGPVNRRMTVRASAARTEKLTAAVVAAAGAVVANPLVAEASVTPSLRNFLYSLLAGATVLAVIAGAVTAVSNFDPVSRE